MHTPTIPAPTPEVPCDPRSVRSLLGRTVKVRTVSGTCTGTLLSSVRNSLWLVSDDVDVMLQLTDVLWVEPTTDLTS